MDNIGRTLPIPYHQRRYQLDAKVIEAGSAILHFSRKSFDQYYYLGSNRGSRFGKKKTGLVKGKLTGAIGIEAIVALRRIGIEPNYVYGVSQVAIDAARSGLPVFIVCIGSELPALLQRLNDENIKYTRIDIRKKR